MQLLKLPTDIKEKIVANNLNVSQALELTNIDASIKNDFVDEIVQNKMTVRQIRKMKHSISKTEPEIGFKKEKKSKDLNIIRKSTLALKVTLSRIDDLIEDAHKINPKNRVELINYLMNLRRTTHSMIDESIKYKKEHQ